MATKKKIKVGDNVSLSFEGKVIEVLRPWRILRNGVRFEVHSVTLENKGKYTYLKIETEL